MTQSHYRDGRNSAKFRMEAGDQGVVFEYGHGPGGCDHLGAREAWVFEHEGLYHMTYDGAGRQAWLVCLATSTDLVQWERHGPIIACGEPGSPDSATAYAGDCGSAYRRLIGASIECNGCLVWPTAGENTALDGLKCRGEDAGHVRFTVPPGVWEFLSCKQA